MLKVCLNHSIVQYFKYMRGAHQRGAPGAVTPFAPYKIHHRVLVEVRFVSAAQMLDRGLANSELATQVVTLELSAILMGPVFLLAKA